MKNEKCFFNMETAVFGIFKTFLCTLVQMVAERFVYLRKSIVIQIGKIKNENIDMSSDKRLSINYVTLSSRFLRQG